MKLTFNQMEAVAEHDLVWFYNHAQADMGIKSNWQAMVSASCFGGSTGFHDSTNSFILNSVGHYRELDKIIKTLSKESQEVLFASFGDVPLSAHVLKLLRKHAGAAYCASVLSDPNVLNNLCERIAKGKSTNEDRLLISKIRIEAVKLYQEAITSYNKIKYEFKKMEK